MRNPSEYCSHFEKAWSTPSIVDIIHDTIGIAQGSVTWGLSSRFEFQFDESSADAFAAESSLLPDDVNSWMEATVGTTPVTTIWENHVTALVREDHPNG